MFHCLALIKWVMVGNIDMSIMFTEYRYKSYVVLSRSKLKVVVETV